MTRQTLASHVQRVTRCRREGHPGYEPTRKTFVIGGEPHTFLICTRCGSGEDPQPVQRCANCGLASSGVTGSQNGAPIHPECHVPDITQPQYRGALSDFLVAPPNARNVTPKGSPR